MPDVALIGGTVFLKSEVFAGAKTCEMKNDCGETTVFIADSALFLPRHGVNRDIPPHKINHQANMQALKDCGVKWIFAANSVGSLKLSIAPGNLLIPDDYIDLWGGGTFFEHSLVHITPQIDEHMMKAISKAAVNLNIPAIEGGVYIQTRGPRLETRAEVNFIKNFAEVVGMTMGSEATAARESGLNYASINSVDNYAHGLVKEPLDENIIRQSAGKNAERIKKIFFETLNILHGEGGGEKK